MLKKDTEKQFGRIYPIVVWVVFFVLISIAVLAIFTNRSYNNVFLTNESIIYENSNLHISFSKHNHAVTYKSYPSNSSTLSASLGLIHKQGFTFSYIQLSNNAVEASLDEDNTILYKNIDNNVDIRYQIIENKGFKEEIIVNKPIDLEICSKDISENCFSPQSEFKFKMQFDDGVSVNRENNNLIIRNQDGEYIGEFQDLYAIDAKNQKTTKDEISLKIEDSILTIEVSDKWLNSEERAFPVIIDPSIVHDTEPEFSGEFNRTEVNSTPEVYLNYRELIADEHTVGLWHMENDWTDASGNGNNGTANGDATFTTSSKVGGYAGTFDGTGDSISIPDAPELDITREISIEAWIKTDGIGGAHQYDWIVSKEHTDSYQGYNLHINDSGYLTLEILANSPTYQQAVGDRDLRDNKWHYVAGTWDGEIIRLYIDGEIHAEQLYTGSMTSNNSNFYIGQRTGGYPTDYGAFNGEIDEVRISNIARTPEEIRAAAGVRKWGVYNSEIIDVGNTIATIDDIQWTEKGVRTGDGETPYSTTGLVAQWNFNETSGTTANNDAEGTSCGGTPSNCDGTLTSFANTTGQDAAVSSGWTNDNRRWGAGALMFDGSNDYITFSDTNMPTGSNSRTIMGWFKPFTTSTSSAQTYFHYGTDAAGQRVTITAVIDQVAVAISECNWGVDNLKLYGWHHLAVVFPDSGSVCKDFIIYLDGVKLNSTALAEAGLGKNTPVNTVTSSGYIGTDGYGSYYEGIIDSISVYSRELSEKEILSNYNASNIEFQTRSGTDATPDDGSWEAWKPITSETSLLNLNSDSSNWSIDNSSAYVPYSKSNDTSFYYEGSGSMKLDLGEKQVDANTVGLWHFEETGGTGAYIKDKTTNNNDGTPTGTSVVNGIRGKARSFNGTSDYINLGNNTNQSFSTVSISAWFKTDATTSQNYFTIIDRGGWDSGEVGLSMSGSSGCGTGKVMIQVYGLSPDQAVCSSEAYNDGIWHHVVGVYTGSDLYIYVDGNLENTAATTGTISADSDSMYIGSRNGTEMYWNGSLDEVSMFDDVLSSEEIYESYRMGRDHYLTRTISSTDLSSKQKMPFYIAADRPGTYLEFSVGEGGYANYQPDSNTVGLWHLEEEVGSGAYVKDSSSNLKHGTVYNSPIVIEGKRGKAYRFNGTNQWIKTSDNDDIDGSSAITVSAWIRIRTHANYQRVVAKYHYDTSGHGVFVLNELPGYQMNMIVMGLENVHTNTVFETGKWYHVVATAEDGEKSKIYVNGVLDGESTSASSGTLDSTTHPITIAASCSSLACTVPQQPFNGVIDEVIVENTARTADEIRQAYEYGRRKHSITIDFAASLDSANLIANSSDKSFTVDATEYGVSEKGSNLYLGDKIIIRENYGGTEYKAQGTVDSLTRSTGAVTVGAWDSGSTFPSGGYTAGADVFKWQREYFDITGSLGEDRDAITQLKLRVTDGNEGRSIWLDDLRYAGDYLTDPTATNNFPSTDQRYMQYRALFSTFDPDVSALLDSVTINYTDAYGTNTVAPSFTVGPAEDPASATTTPTNSGSEVTFKATATDSDGQDYYLAICKTNSITTGNTNAPTCGGGNWCITSSNVISGVQASCTYTAQASDVESNDWYAFVCDRHPSGLCSSASQGSGDSGSPFKVNHKPTLTTVTNNGPKNPGETITFSSTASDSDTDGSSDTIKLVVCKTSGLTSGDCDGGSSDKYCESTLTASNPSCTYSIPTPNVHGDINYYAYAVDEHGLASSEYTNTFSVNDINPVISSVVFNEGNDLTLTNPQSTNMFKMTATVTDNNSCQDINSATASIYRSGVTYTNCDEALEGDNNNCYPLLTCYPENNDVGTGNDGSCTISASTSLNISTSSCVGRGAADAVNFTSTVNNSVGNSYVTVSTANPDVNGLAVGDEILIINVQGTSSDYTNVGKWEINKISSFTGTGNSTINLDKELTNTYDGTTQKIIIQRIPQCQDPKIVIKTGLSKDNF